MAIVDAAGVVTKETKYGDTSRILTVVTKNLGRISILAGNARKGKSGLLTATGLFAYSRFTLFKSNSSSLYKLNEGELIHSFSELHESLDGMAFAAYFCDLTNFIVQEGDPNAPQVELLLRALYLLSRVVTNPTPTQNAEFEKIKAVFEFRSLMLDGRLPDMSCCGGCGKLDGLHFLSPLDGKVYCEKCIADKTGIIRINNAILAAISYIALAADKKEFSFTLPPPSLKYLSEVGENCIETIFEHRFKTLEYLRKVTALG